MRTLKEYLVCEHFVNCHDESDMRKYADVVWDILVKSYKYCGGMAGMDNVDQLISETDMWKLVRRHGDIVACIVYSKKRGGRKACYAGTDGSNEGKAGLCKIMQEDNLLPEREAWGEYSGKAVSTMFNQGAVPVPASVASEIMKDKKFIEIKPDGFYYVREIGGHPHTKLMMGNPKWKSEFVPEHVRQKLKDLARKYDADDATDSKILSK